MTRNVKRCELLHQNRKTITASAAVAERKSRSLAESRRASSAQYAAARPTVSKFVEFRAEFPRGAGDNPLDGAVGRTLCVRFRELLHTKIRSGLPLLSRQDTGVRAPVQHPEIRDNRTNTGTLVVSTFRGKSTGRDRLRADHAGRRVSAVPPRKEREYRESLEITRSRIINVFRKYVMLNP